MTEEERQSWDGVERRKHNLVVLPGKKDNAESSGDKTAEAEFARTIVSGLDTVLLPTERKDFSGFIGRMVAPKEPRSAWLRYGLAVVLPCIGFLATYLMFDLRRAPYFTLFMVSVVISSLFGGFGPGLIDTALSAILAIVVAPPAWTLRLLEPEDGIHFALFAVLGCLLSSIIGVVGELQRRSDHERVTLATTLRSIGDAVITADNNGRITFLNKVAEQATGWNFNEVRCKPIGEVFRVVHETTRSVSLDPLALATSSANGLSNSDLLIRRDGAEL